MRFFAGIVIIIGLAGCVSSATPGRIVAGTLIGAGTLGFVRGATEDCGASGDLGCGLDKEMLPQLGAAAIVAGLVVLLYNETIDRTPEPASPEPAPVAHR